jgi:ATP-dependent Clp protease ATP-binding subunit ClpC
VARGPDARALFLLQDAVVAERAKPVPRRRALGSDRVERFSERARNVIVHAQVEARGLKHNYIGTEHLLLGLLQEEEEEEEEEGIAARVLASLGITVEDVGARVVRIVGLGDELPVGHVRFTRPVQRVLELSLQEMRALGHRNIGTERLLLGLSRENEGVAARILLDFDAGPDRIRTEVLEYLSRSHH